MKCSWCEKETNNEPKTCLNGYQQLADFFHCDECKKASEQAMVLLHKKKGDKAEGESHRERLNPEEQCNHEWGSEEHENSSKSHYVCRKCSTVMR